MSIERLSKAMTYGGACTAAGCGVASEAVIAAPVAASNMIAMGDFGILVGVIVGVLGLLIQGCLAIQKWRHASEQRREERELARLKIRIEAKNLRRIEKANG